MPDFARDTVVSNRDFALVTQIHLTSDHALARAAVACHAAVVCNDEADFLARLRPRR